MSDGLKLLSTIVENGSASLLRDLELEYFVDREREVYSFVRRHYRRYGTIPVFDTVENELDISLPEAEEVPEYYLKRVHDRHLYARIRGQYSDLQESLRVFDMDRTREVIGDMSRSTRILHSATDIRSLGEASASVMGEYDYAHANPGISGVPVGWPRYDAMTGGYQPGDLITYVARPEMGKTYTVLSHVAAAYATGHSVLVVTMEMTIEQITRRLLGIMAGIDPTFIRKGTLSTYVKRRLDAYVDQIASADRLKLFSGGMKKRALDVDTLIQEFRPDIVFIDGLYLMWPESKRNMNKSERVSEVLDEVKQITIARNIPVVATTQFNRVAGSKGKEGSLENIAYSDAISTHSSIVVGIQSGLPGREQETRQAILLKGREGEMGVFPYNYGFRPMDFSEIRPDEEVQEASSGLDWVG